MSFHSFLSFGSGTALATQPANNQLSTLPVCIVGAGPGGLTVAHELQDKGAHYIIFDSQPEVGGKCQAYYDNLGYYHPMGALLFVNETYRETLPLIEASGLPIMSVRFNYGWHDWFFEWSTGDTQERPATSEQVSAEIAYELTRYGELRATLFEPNLTTMRYTSGVPPEFSVPIGQWLLANDLPYISSIMESAMTASGYGDVSQTPALYMLQFFTVEVVEVYAGIIPINMVDFHQVFVSYAGQLKNPVYTNSTVTKIDRSQIHPIITYKDNGISKTQQCSSVVLAFPPIQRALAAIDMPLSPEEATVFSAVARTPYWSGAVATKVPNDFYYFQNPPIPFGEPAAFVRLFNESNIATTWSWGGSNTTTDIAYTFLLQTLGRINKDPRNVSETSTPLTGDDVKLFTDQDYFPHFETLDLAAGIYDQYNALQGKNNTYYTSGLNGFELVEFAIRAGQDLVASFF